jgi:hypothetical protein
VLASAVTMGTDVTAVFLQYGVLGAFAIIALAFFRTVYRRETQRADRAEAALSELNRDIREKVIPVLTEANRTVADAAILLRDAKARL